MAAIDFTELGLHNRDPANEPLETSTRLAANAVLLALARADHVYTAAEVTAIVEFCTKAFALPERQRLDLLLAAGHLIEEPGHIEQACRLLREDLTIEQRETIARQLDTVMLADGKVTREEERLYQRILLQLALSPQKERSKRRQNRP